METVIKWINEGDIEGYMAPRRLLVQASPVEVAKQDFHTRQAAGADLQEEAEEAHTGFEPVLPP